MDTPPPIPRSVNDGAASGGFAKVSFCMMGFGYSQEVAEQCIALFSQLGYDGIEYWKQYLDHANLDWVRLASEAAGLTIVQVCPYFDFTTSQETYEESLREAERFVGYARKLGALPAFCQYRVRQWSTGN
jgi:sugar phosphate isomerase/epimerase